MQEEIAVDAGGGNCEGMDRTTIIQLLSGLRIKVHNWLSTYGRVKVKTIHLFLR